MAVGIPEDLLKAVAEKIVRGSEYALTKRVVDKPYDVQIHFVHAHHVPENLVLAFDGPGAQHEHLGPGFRLIRLAPHDERNAAIYKVTIWDTIIFYGVIMVRDGAVIDSESTGDGPLLPGETKQSASGKVGTFFLALFRAVAVVALVGLGLSGVLMASRRSVD